MEPVAASRPSATRPESLDRSAPSGQRPLRESRDRRCHTRFTASGLLVWSPRLKGRVLELSDIGLRVSTTTRLAPGEHLSFHLVGEARSIASAVVRWCQLDCVFEAAYGEIKSIYHVGLELLHEPHRLPPTQGASS